MAVSRSLSRRLCCGTWKGSSSNPSDIGKKEKLSSVEIVPKRREEKETLFSFRFFRVCVWIEGKKEMMEVRKEEENGKGNLWGREREGEMKGKVMMTGCKESSGAEKEDRVCVKSTEGEKILRHST